LFLHGIGGAKYDQLTDLILHRFYGIQPPAFLTLTATVKLFQDQTSRLQEEIREAKRLLREYRFHPERHVPHSPSTSHAISEKMAWIGRDLPRGQRRQRHREIERLNRQLGTRLADRSRQVSRDLAAAKAHLRQQQPLASREFSFCLFPEATLRDLLLDLSSGEA
jgi:hypothetical protein